MLPSARRTCLLVAVLTLLPLGVGNAGDDGGTPWSAMGTDYYQVLFQAGRDADAKQIRRFLDAAIASFKTEFAEFPVEDLLRVKCTIYLHPKGTGKASESFASINSGVYGDGEYSAVIDLLTPSEYDPGYRSNVNEPPGDDHFHKLVVHEYATILLDRITRAKKAGWRFFAAPRWFVDGYEEYLGLMLSSPRNRNEVLGKYLALHRENPRRIDFSFGISVEDDYIDGAMLLLFMHETFGAEKVHAVLASGERRFGTAMASVLGVGLKEFQQRWDKWIAKRLG